MRSARKGRGVRERGCKGLERAFLTVRSVRKGRSARKERERFTRVASHSEISLEGSVKEGRDVRDLPGWLLTARSARRRVREGGGTKIYQGGSSQRGLSGRAVREG